jgi:hypothetical protein
MRYFTRLATGRGAAGFAGVVLAVSGLLVALLDSPHRAWGVGVLVIGGLVVVAAVAWVKLSVAAFATAQRHGGVNVPPAQPRVASSTAERLLATELEVAKQSVVRLVAGEGKFPRGVTPLPIRRWRECEDALAEQGGPTYTAVSAAYARIEEFNRMTVDRANLYVGRWLSFHEDDDVDGLLVAITDALSALHSPPRSGIST